MALETGYGLSLQLLSFAVGVEVRPIQVGEAIAMHRVADSGSELNPASCLVSVAEQRFATRLGMLLLSDLLRILC